VPAGETSSGFSRRILETCDVVVTPGTGFGPGGEGWFRISLTAPDDRIATAATRLGRL
jgi:LL-diaminopimelate aminotransferase